MEFSQHGFWRTFEGHVPVAVPVDHTLMHWIKPFEASFQLTEKETPANVQDNQPRLFPGCFVAYLRIPSIINWPFLLSKHTSVTWTTFFPCIPSLSLHHVQCTTTHLVPGTFGQRRRYGIGGVDKNVDLKRWRCWHKSIRGPGPNPLVVPGFQIIYLIYLDEIPVAMDQTYNCG